MFITRTLLVLLLLMHNYALAVDIHLDIDEIKETAEKEFEKITKTTNVKSSDVVLSQTAEIRGNLAIDHSMIAVHIVPEKASPYGLQWYYAFGLNGKKGLFVGFHTKSSDNVTTNLHLSLPEVVASLSESMTATEKAALVEKVSADPLVKTAQISTVEISNGPRVVSLQELHVSPKSPTDVTNVFEQLLTQEGITEVRFKDISQERFSVTVDSKTLVNADVILNDRALNLRTHPKLTDKVFTTNPHLGAPFFIGTAGIPFFKEYLVFPKRSESFDIVLQEVSETKGVLIKNSQHQSQIIHIVVRSKEADDRLQRMSKIELDIINDRTEELAGLCKPFQSMFD